MQRDQKNYAQLLNRLLLAFAISLVLPLSAKAAVTTPLDLATIPLANSPTVTIQPNLLFVLDDSGSMSWDWMPDWANSGDAALFRNASYNTVAYNPAVHYSPPAFFDAGGLNVTQYPSQIGMATATGASTATKPNWRLVKNNAYSGLGFPTGTSNLEGDANFYHTVAGEYCTKPDLKVCVAQTSPSATHPFPAPVRWCNNSTNASAATPSAGSCQGSRLSGFNNLRTPGTPSYESTIQITSASSTPRVEGITVAGQQIMKDRTGSSNNQNTLAQGVVDLINNCTSSIAGNCDVTGYSATRSGNTIIITSPSATAVTPVLSFSSGSLTAVITAFSIGTPGNRLFVNIVSSNNSYPLPGSTTKASSRTDCAGTTCTYIEEMTNYANWWTYYHTRGQTMKTAASLAFKDVGEDFRVGFMTTSTRSAQMLNFNTFNTAQKALWYSKFFAATADRNTPLRGSLSKAGRIYANDTGAKGGVFTDPVEYECQQNFTLLTTDGFWNTGDETSTYAGGPRNVTNTANVGNLDSASAGTPRPKREGATAQPDTLADVAKYYFDTDLRTAALGNCIGALGNDVCQSPAPSTANPKQNMVTLTLGMGVDGTLAYTNDYKTAANGDYFNITDAGGATKNWPDPILNTQAERIDDLWHAAVNGDGTYFSAKNPTDLAKSLKEALASIQVKLGAGAAAATSTLNLELNFDNFSYKSNYTTGQWIGNLEKRLIDATTANQGVTAVACVEDVVIAPTCTSPSSIIPDGVGGNNCVTPGVTDPAACSGVLVGTDCKVSVPTACSGTLRGRVSALTDTRIIKMNDGSDGLIDFNYGNLSAAQKATFDSAFLAANLTQWTSLTPAQLANATGENLLNYLRGQKGFDENAVDPDNRVFRKRQAVLGDVVDSTPAFIGKATFSFSDPGYATFKTAQETRAETVYLGANDGMLHAFDADTLQERWAYVPSMVIPNMWKLADAAYGNKHSYYANGDAIISDICVSACTGASAVWKTILVAGLKGGGRGYYALDITNPIAPALMWEFDANDEPNLGYTFGNPVITKKPDGTWVVLVTSGYNNIPDNSAFYALPSTKFKPNNPALYLTGNGQGYLYVLNAVTGSKLTEITTGAGNTTTPSGLANIVGFADDAEKNNTATLVYGGDLLGNLWRFNIETNTAMKLATLKAGSIPQPITTSPDLGLVNNKKVVFVGTGKYLEIGDLTNTDQQTLYAIKDDNATATLLDPRSTLVPQTLVPHPTDPEKRVSGTSNVVDFNTGSGWYVDFPEPGERQNVVLELNLGTLVVPTIVPTSSACQPAGHSWSNSIDYKTGLAPANGIASKLGSSPIVGYNVIYVNGKPKIIWHYADGTTSSPEDIVTGSGIGFKGQRAIWRELTQ